MVTTVRWTRKFMLKTHSYSTYGNRHTKECGRQSDQRENYTCHVTLMTYVGAHCNCNYEMKFIASVLWECSLHKSGNLNFRISLPIQMAKIIYRKQDGYSSLLSSSLLARLFVYFYVSQWNFFYKISIYALICFTCEKTCWMCSSYYLLEMYVFIDWVDGMDSKLIYFLSQYSKHSVNFIRHSFKLLSPCPCLRLYQEVFHLMH